MTKFVIQPRSESCDDYHIRFQAFNYYIMYVFILEGCSNSVSNLSDETLINRSDTDLYKDEVLPSIKDCDGGLYVGQEEWAVTYPNDPGLVTNENYLFIFYLLKW